MQIGVRGDLSNVEEVGFLCPMSTQQRAANSEFRMSLESCGVWWNWKTGRSDYSTCKISNNELLQLNDLLYTHTHTQREKRRYFILKEENKLMIGENNKNILVSFMTNFVS